MPSIGDKTFTILNGQIQEFAESVEDITRPGVNGVGFRKIGQRSDPFTMESWVDVASAAAAESLYTDYLAIVGTVIDIETQQGETRENFIVIECVRVLQKQTPRIVGGSNNTGVVLACRWTLQAAGVPA